MLLEYDWKQLKSDISPEQAFYIMLLLIFEETVQVEQNTEEEAGFRRENVAAAVRGIPDYDFKEGILQISEKIGEKLRQNWLEYDRRQRELTAQFLAQKQKLQRELKKELMEEAREDGENIFESQHEE